MTTYGIHVACKGYLAFQGLTANPTKWYQDRITGWGEYSTKDYAKQVAEHFIPDEEYKIVERTSEP